MNPHPTFVYSDDMAIKALEIMESVKNRFTVLPVVDRKKKIHRHHSFARPRPQRFGLGQGPHALACALSSLIPMNPSLA